MVSLTDWMVDHPEAMSRARRLLLIAAGVLLVVFVILAVVFDYEPPQFPVLEVANERRKPGQTLVTGYVTTSTYIEIMERMLDKRGGYLSNDVTPPAILMDNVPEWEWGVLLQARDMAVTFRNDFSRSQTQSTEDVDLVAADNKLRIDSESWMFPAAENEYRGAIKALERYLDRLAAQDDSDSQFFARADNLRNWLSLVEKRLGDLAQRLGSSVGRVQLNTDLAGDPAATQATRAPLVKVARTPWLQIDNVFYEARGQTWALLHLLRAVEHDFASVLEQRNALVSLRQLIRELEDTQAFVWSPMILNGHGFGFVANHSLVMASYISRANAAVLDLRELLERG